MSLGVAQQVGTKNDGQNSKNKQPTTHTIIFLFFPNFSSGRWIFATFLFFSTIFLYIFFSE
jgi:hypothetical protein